MPTAAPTLDTARLVLRVPVLADWPAFADTLTSDRARYMGGPYSVAAAWGVFCHGVALWPLYGMGALSIVARDSGALLGQVEVNQGPRFPEAELGWQLHAGAEGRGYAHEAAAALRDWVWATQGRTTLVSYIDPDNARSIRLAQRLGAVPDAAAPKQDAGDLVFRHNRP